MSMAAILINGSQSPRSLHMKFEEIGPGVSEEKSFKGMNGRPTDDNGRQAAGHHNSSSGAFGSGELKPLDMCIHKFCCSNPELPNRRLLSLRNIYCQQPYLKHAKSRTIYCSNCYQM